MNGVGVVGDVRFDDGGAMLGVMEGLSGAVSVYNVSTKQQRAQFTVREGSDGVPTAMAMERSAVDGGDAPARSKKRARKKAEEKNAADGESTILCIGYSNGELRFFSTGAVESVQAEHKGHGDAVSVKAMAMSANGATLFVGGADMAVSSWKTGSGKLISRSNIVDRGEIGCLAVSPSSKAVAVCTSKAFILDGSTLKSTRTLVGHASPISAAVFASEKVLYTGCSGDKHISRWELDRKENTALASYLSSAPVVSLATDQKDFIASLSTDMTVSIFRASRPGKPIGTVRSNVLSVSMPRPGWIVLAHGKKSNPSFDSFEVEDGNVELEAPDANDKVGKVSKSNASTQKVKDALSLEQKATVMGVESDYRPPVADEAEAAVEDSDSEAGEDEQTIEEKLAAIGVGSKQGQGLSGSKKEESLEGAESVAAVLAQALATKDSALLETALNSAKKLDEIKRSVEKLPSESVVPMLTALSVRVRSRPRRAGHLSLWLRALIVQHAAQLRESSGSEVNNALTELYQSIDERVRLHRRLAMLEGRLELVLSQAQRVAKTTDLEAEEPVVEFVGEEEESEVAGWQMGDLASEELDSYDEVESFDEVESYDDDQMPVE